MFYDPSRTGLGALERELVPRNSERVESKNVPSRPDSQRPERFRRQRNFPLVIPSPCSTPQTRSPPPLLFTTAGGDMRPPLLCSPSRTDTLDHGRRAWAPGPVHLLERLGKLFRRSWRTLRHPVLSPPDFWFPVLTSVRFMELWRTGGAEYHRQTLLGVPSTTHAPVVRSSRSLR